MFRSAIHRVSLATVLLLSLTFVVNPTAQGQENVNSAELTRLFAEGSLAYDSADFVAALQSYNKILESGFESPELYYNLGNTYFELGELGFSILNYLRAERLNPSDEDIQDNLRFARSFVSVQMQGVQLNPVAEFFRGLTGRWTVDTWGWLTSLSLLILCLALALSVLRLTVGFMSRFAVWLALALFVCLVALTTFKYRQEFSPDRAVVTAVKAPVTSKPSGGGEVEFEAVSGMQIEIRDEVEGYYLALFENKRQGWIPAETVVRL